MKVRLKGSLSVAGGVLTLCACTVTLPVVVDSGLPFDAGPPPTSRIPTVTTPCVDERTELAFDGDELLVCWGEDCLTSERAPRPRPDAGTWATGRVGRDDSTPEPTFDATRVCTAEACDPLGPRLAKVIRAADTPQLRSNATKGHAIVVLERGLHRELWNRALDRRLPLPVAPRGVPHPEVPELMPFGPDRVFVTWSYEEYCNSTTQVLDAQGRPLGDSFSTPINFQGDGDLVRFGDDQYLALADFGEIAWLEHGRPVAFVDLLRPSGFGPPPDPSVQSTAVSGAGQVGLLWCISTGCRVTRVTPQRSGDDFALALSETLVWPSCPSAD